MAYAEVDYNLSSPYVHSRVDSNTFTMGNPMSESTLTYARDDFIPQSGALDLVSGSANKSPTYTYCRHSTVCMLYT
jgi:hypothetical protein